jgi:oligosaccharide repeat unit polymerase
MVFIAITIISFLLWGALGQRKLLSVSLANLMGTLVFVALGLEFDPVIDSATTIVVGTVFYFSLVIGERSVKLLPINNERYSRFGQALALNPATNLIFTLFFIVLGFLPVAQVLFSGKSVGDLFVSTWATNTAQDTSQMLIELSSRSISRLEALFIGAQNQLIGFWYLSAGIVFIRKRRWFYLVFAAYLFGSLLTSGGFRSLLMLSLFFPILLYLLSAKRIPRLRTILLLGALSLGVLLTLDLMRSGRQGLVTEDSLQNRIDRTLRTDFAFGGLGLRLGLDNLPFSSEQGISYLVRTVVLPIPRVLWPDKPTSNPNQEFTERATGLSYDDYGSLLLFTPLGEALFNFGYFGIIVIPFLYGFVTRLLERFYSSSNVYYGLLAQVYIWAFLAMRLTFFNLFSTLIVANFFLISIIILGAHFGFERRLLQFRFAQGR